MPSCPTCATDYPSGTAFCAKDGTSLIGDVAPAGADESLKEGDVVGEYKVIALLGEGGFGTVYSGIHPMIGKSAAIKVLKREFSAKAEMVSRFLAEARAVNQIRHRNIIDIFSFGVLADGRHYYVMELLEGTTLDRHLKARGGRLPPEEAISILRPLARALGAAHTHGIAHRDLKPENVFLTADDDGRPIPKLLDFGIAKLAGDLGAQHKTRSGIPMGTPSYMSPEQVHGRGVDHRTDIYAFGVVVFELLTGRLPFDGESMIDVMVKHASVAAPKLTDFAPLAPELDAPVLTMMAKDPAARYQSVIEAMDALTEAAARAGIVEASKLPPLSAASGAGALTPAFHTPSAFDFASNAATIAAPGAGEGPKTFAGTTASGAEASAKRGWAPWLAAAGVVSVAAGVGAFFALRTTTPPSANASVETTSAPTTEPSITATAETSAPAGTVDVAPVDKPPVDVLLKLKTVPADCEVWLGDTKLGVATDDMRVPYGSEKVKLSIRRAGFAPQDLEVTPNDDIVEIVTLKAIVGKKKDYEW